MYYDPCYVYDFSSFCVKKPIYVLFVNATKWSTGGNFANHATGTGTRYFEVKITYFNSGGSGATSTTDIFYSYSQSSLTSYNTKYDGGSVTFPINGGSATSYFNIGCTPSNIILPIELISFTGKYINNKIELSWQTASEINNDYFEIYKSRDLYYFEKLGTIQGAGNSSSLLNYNFTDNNPDQGNNYYQLKQIDFDGLSSKSGIISIRSDNNTNINIFFDNGDITIQSKNEIDLVSIFDITGKEIYSSKNKTQISLNSIPSGVYLIKVISGDEILTRRFLQQHSK